MDNNELLGAISEMFDKKVSTISDMFEKKVEEVKDHTGVLIAKLESDIKAIAEGHSVLDTKLDRLETKVDKLETKVDKLDMKVDKLENEMSIVKNYVIGVDTKLNEHEIILKRVK